VAGVPSDDRHVRWGGADIRPGDVPAAERVDGLADIREKVVAAVFRRTGRERDDGLPATVGQAGEGGLVGHRSRQAQGIVQPVAPGNVRLDAAPAERGSRLGGVEADDDRLAGPAAMFDPQYVRCGTHVASKSSIQSMRAMLDG
jgi:hypothetical protein